MASGECVSCSKGNYASHSTRKRFASQNKSKMRRKVCDTTAMWEVRQINILCAKLFIAQGIHNKLLIFILAFLIFRQKEGDEKALNNFHCQLAFVFCFLIVTHASKRRRRKWITNVEDLIMSIRNSTRCHSVASKLPSLSHNLFDNWTTQTFSDL